MSVVDPAKQVNKGKKPKNTKDENDKDESSFDSINYDEYVIEKMDEIAEIFAMNIFGNKPFLDIGKYKKVDENDIDQENNENKKDDKEKPKLQWEADVNKTNEIWKLLENVNFLTAIRKSAKKLSFDGHTALRVFNFNDEKNNLPEIKVGKLISGDVSSNGELVSAKFMYERKNIASTLIVTETYYGNNKMEISLTDKEGKPLKYFDLQKNDAYKQEISLMYGKNKGYVKDGKTIDPKPKIWEVKKGQVPIVYIKNGDINDNPKPDWLRSKTKFWQMKKLAENINFRIENVVPIIYADSETTSDIETLKGKIKKRFFIFRKLGAKFGAQFFGNDNQPIAPWGTFDPNSRNLTEAFSNFNDLDNAISEKAFSRINFYTKGSNNKTDIEIRASQQLQETFLNMQSDKFEKWISKFIRFISYYSNSEISKEYEIMFKPNIQKIVNETAQMQSLDVLRKDNVISRSKVLQIAFDISNQQAKNMMDEEIEQLNKENSNLKPSANTMPNNNNPQPTIQPKGANIDKDNGELGGNDDGENN